MKLLAFVLLLVLAAVVSGPVSLEAQPYAEHSVGRLLHNYGDEFRDGFVAGYTAAFFTTGGECPLSISPRMLLAALQMNVKNGRISLTENDEVGLTRSLAAMGCTHRFGTKNQKGA